ncbi:hypothetical protein DDN14_01855 [Vibrio cholerae]|uniref:hypothetical protein n=1 Tax=Vibrio cholerae TaxID=666 RepID=UPI001C67A178|nr:hypothetical protein [Vibrio cholerae]EGR4068035.1 hypothetical protein [Vibrio cholerae]MVB13856.1 hypothetical protein [Vibrio cholerae]
MKIESVESTTLLITEIENFDPVTVHLENYAPGKGGITIECFGEAWSSKWTAMGGRRVEQFFVDCDEHYLAGRLSSISCEIDDFEKFAEVVKRKVLKLRRDNEMGKSEARELFDEIPDDFESRLTCSMYEPLLRKVIGFEWLWEVPSKPNHQYESLTKLITYVQSGLKQHFKADDVREKETNQ